MFDRLAHYVWALAQPWPSNPEGYDVRWMVPSYEAFDQANIATIESFLMDEIRVDARHQKQFWLRFDGALDAIGMLESDGYGLSGSGELTAGAYEEQEKSRKKDPYTSFVKANVERVKNHYRNVPIMYEAHAEDKELFGEAVRGLNEYNAKILEINHWNQIRDAYIHDGVSFGSGVLDVRHKKDMMIPEDTWFEEHVRSGRPLEISDFMRFDRLANTHKIEYVPTFELIRHRYARGEASRDLNHSCHSIITRVQQRAISEVAAEYPHLDGELSPSRHQVYVDTNPFARLIDLDQRTITQFNAQIKMPLYYELPLQIHLGGGRVETYTKLRRRYAVVEVVILDGYGIADMTIDAYAHNGPTFVQWMHTPSSKHGCGIGLPKYGRDMERVRNIMMNGQLRFFGTMVKGGGFYLKGVLDPNAIEKRSKENTWIGIDPKSLPQEYRNRPIGELIQDSRPTSMPAVYDQLMLRAEDAANRAMMVPDASRGIKQGNSGRQELILTDQAEQVMASGTSAYENSFLPLGKKVHSNIIQHDGSRWIEVETTDPSGAPEIINLNEPAELEERYDEHTDDYYVVPILIRNNLLTMRYTTRLSTRSLIPTNPAQRLFFYQDLIQRIYEILQSGPQGLVILRFMNKYAFASVPGLEDLINQMQEIYNAQIEQQSEVALAERQMEQERQQKEDAARAAELAQNKQRLDQNNVAQVMDGISKLLKAAKDNPGAQRVVDQFINQTKN